MAGRKVFGVQTILQSADVQGYLMDQTVPRFATTTERDGQWPNPPDGALCVTTDTTTLWVRRAGVWAQPLSTVTGPDATTGITHAARIRGGYLAGNTDSNGNFLMALSPPLGNVMLAMATNSDAPNARFITPYGSQFSVGATSVTWHVSLAGGTPMMSATFSIFYLIIDYP